MSTSLGVYSYGCYLLFGLLSGSETAHLLGIKKLKVMRPGPVLEGDGGLRRPEDEAMARGRGRPEDEARARKREARG